MPSILAIDQSTSATKALLFNELGECVDRESRAHRQYYPQPGWVEHDAEEIWQNVLNVTRTIIERLESRDELDQLVGLSLTNQRETIVVFDRASGRPLHKAIVWQCRRSQSLCAEKIADGCDPWVHARTGLRIDPYFSASKIHWLMQHQPKLKDKLDQGEALLGTIDTYLIYRLTEGQVFATDSTNASRTLLFNITDLQWDKKMCALWEVPMAALPDVRDSEAYFGETRLNSLLSRALPICGVMGDSQASLFAQRCFETGMAKVTFGTGSSVLLNIGSTPLFSEHGVVTALAWTRANEPTYAFEGIIINSAATLTWLRDQLGFVKEVAEIEKLADELEDSGGVFLVPAFSGLGLPHWQPSARAAIVGLSGHSDRRHLAKAAIESIAYQLSDAVHALQEECGIEVGELKADGGPTANHSLMQFTADLTRSRLSVSKTPDCSALGAAFMGLLGLGVYASTAEIAALQQDDVTYLAKMSLSTSNKLHAGWQSAVKQVLAGIDH